MSLSCVAPNFQTPSHKFLKKKKKLNCWRIETKANAMMCKHTPVNFIFRFFFSFFLQNFTINTLMAHLFSLHIFFRRNTERPKKKRKRENKKLVKSHLFNTKIVNRVATRIQPERVKKNV